jgi:hypothetical protein
MELEEQEGVERPANRCEVCGARLTEDEMREVLLGNGPVLCKIHAAEEVPISEETAAFDDPA